MAKYEKRGQGNYKLILNTLHEEIMSKNLSSSLEEKSDLRMDHVRIQVRTYERYSILGKNRLSLSFTLVSNLNDNRVSISLSASGGSQGVFFKVNTWGEDSFLNSVKNIVNNLIK